MTRRTAITNTGTLPADFSLTGNATNGFAAPGAKDGGSVVRP
jgi:hypothetical protein